MLGFLWGPPEFLETRVLGKMLIIILTIILRPLHYEHVPGPYRVCHIRTVLGGAEETNLTFTRVPSSLTRTLSHVQS